MPSTNFRPKTLVVNLFSKKAKELSTQFPEPPLPKVVTSFVVDPFVETELFVVVGHVYVNFLVQLQIRSKYFSAAKHFLFPLSSKVAIPSKTRLPRERSKGKQFSVFLFGFAE